MIIGLSGLSSSGKTSVAKILAKLIPGLCLVHQDDFYFPPEQIPMHPVLNEQNWDSPDSIDFNKFINTLKNIKDDPNFKYHVDSLEIDESTEKFLLSAKELDSLKQKIQQHESKLQGTYIVDGFMLFTNPQVLELLDMKLFYKASSDQCKKRRESRQGYNIIGGFWVDPPGYFDKLVWPEYYQYHKHLFENGENEELIKSTGGELNNNAKKLGLKDFSNPDGGTLFDLVNRSLDYIISNI